MFRLALSSHIYFLLFETPIVTLWSSCARKHVMWQRVFLGASEFKVRNLIWNGSFCNLCALALWLAFHIFATQSVLTSPNEGETAVHCCDSPLSVLVMLMSRNVFHVVSALQSIVFMFLPLPASMPPVWQSSSSSMFSNYSGLSSLLTQ